MHFCSFEKLYLWAGAKSVTVFHAIGKNESVVDGNVLETITDNLNDQREEILILL